MQHKLSDETNPADWFYLAQDRLRAALTVEDPARMAVLAGCMGGILALLGTVWGLSNKTEVTVIEP